MPARSEFKVTLLEVQANAAFEAAMKKWEEDLEAERAYFAELMRDPAKNLEIGLPPELPEESITILAHTRALDKLAPKQPTRKEFYERYGVV